MATINVIRHSDGRTLFPCGSHTSPPTNPRAGPPASGNTVIWNGRTRATTLVIPRQNPVNVDTWSPQSSRTYSGPVTYQKPPIRTASHSAVIARQNVVVNNPCPVIFPGRSLCGQ